MNIDEFLDKEASSFEGKTRIMGASPGFEFKADEETDIFKQIQRVREYFESKKISMATKEFTMLRERYLDMTKRQAQQNKFIFNELLKLNNELIASIDTHSQESIKKINLIRQLLLNAIDYLNKNMIPEANKLYVEIQGLYGQIPDLFYEEKRKVYEEMLSFYVLLSKYKETSLRQKFIRLRDSVMETIRNAQVHMRSGNTALVRADFETVSELYEQLPDEFPHEKALVYNEILKQFSFVYTSNLSSSSQQGTPTYISDVGGETRMSNEEVAKNLISSFDYNRQDSQSTDRVPSPPQINSGSMDGIQLSNSNPYTGQPQEPDYGQFQSASEPKKNINDENEKKPKGLLGGLFKK